ncbi:MAG: Arabinose 5-phosphate isomerase KdsD [Planctomycetota bacterium]|jgi:arabinose-5-phosphate isomerase
MNHPGSAESERDPAVVPAAQLEQLREARRVIRQEAEALLQLSDGLDLRFCEAVRLIEECTGSVIVTGVGKAGLIGRKLTATFCSTGTRAHFLHPTEARHGDLGCLSAADVVLALSNSGETDELLSLLPVLRRMQVPLIAITRDDQNPLAKAANVVLRLGRHTEACELGLAPSCSTTAMLALGDALALVLSRVRGLTAERFALFHPAGSLGRKLAPVRDVMRHGSQLRVASETATVREVMIQLSRPGRRTGAVMLINASGRLSGLFTDSDLARLFESRRDDQLDVAIEHVMTRNPVTIHPEALLPEAIRLMSERHLSELPVIDGERHPVGLLDITDVLTFVEPAAVEKSAPSPQTSSTSRSA